MEPIPRIGGLGMISNELYSFSESLKVTFHIRLKNTQISAAANFHAPRKQNSQYKSNVTAWKPCSVAFTPWHGKIYLSFTVLKIHPA